jgi:hypothetical protein
MRRLGLLFFLSGCAGGSGDSDAEVTDPGLPLLGGNTHTLENVAVWELDEGDFDDPTDLAFHHDEPELLLITQRGSNGMLVFDTSDDEPEGELRTAFGSEHFLASPSGIAFGDNGFFATTQDTSDVTQPQTPTDFMGPTLWIADMDEFEAGWASHYDMLHNSPNGAGIAWDDDNAYWIFDGYHESITWYDFNDDHGGGGEDHSDGEVARYAEGEVSYVEGVVSNLAFDRETDLLYVADSGNGRVAVLDTDSGERGDRILPNYDGGEQYEMEDAEIWTLVDSETVPDLEVPSGLDLHDGLLYVGDHETGIVYAFTLEGELVDWLDLELDAGALQGITFDQAGNLWFIDADAEQVVRISAP